jgi:hypothetical protein
VAVSPVHAAPAGANATVQLVPEPPESIGRLVAASVGTIAPAFDPFALAFVSPSTSSSPTAIITNAKTSLALDIFGPSDA